jgi:predicted Holliday junction resolvase-like endonuclease
VVRITVVLAVILVFSILSNVILAIRRNPTRDIGTGRLIESVNSNIDSVRDVARGIRKECSDVPGRVLATIQGSTNARSGKLHELICAMKITSMYKSLIPLGSPIDYVGICDEYIDFIEVKSGSSQLTKSERHIRDLIEAGKVRFLLMRSEVDLTSMILPEEEEDEGADHQ